MCRSAIIKLRVEHLQPVECNKCVIISTWNQASWLRVRIRKSICNLLKILWTVTVANIGSFAPFLGEIHDEFKNILASQSPLLSAFKFHESAVISAKWLSFGNDSFPASFLSCSLSLSPVCMCMGMAKLNQISHLIEHIECILLSFVNQVKFKQKIQRIEWCGLFVLFHKIKTSNIELKTS